MKLRMKRDAEGCVDISIETEDDQEGRDLKEAVLEAGAEAGFDSPQIVIQVLRELERVGYGEEDIHGHEGEVCCVMRRREAIADDKAAL